MFKYQCSFVVFESKSSYSNQSFWNKEAVTGHLLVLAGVERAESVDGGTRYVRQEFHRPELTDYL